MEIGKHVAVAILLLFSYPSQAQYIGIGQQGIEAGKELERHDLRISFAFDAAHFSTGIKTHFESKEYFRLWYFYNLTNQEIIKLKIGVSTLYSPIFVYDRDHYDYANYFAVSPLAYEVTIQISNSISLTANEALIDIYSEQNGLEYQETRIGSFIPKFGIRYKF